MDSAVWGFIGVVVGGLITGIVSIWLEQIRADKAAALDSARRRDDRRLGHDNFQRETLLAFQEAINAVARTTIQIHHHDVMASKKGGAWRSTPLDPELDSAAQQASLLLSTLRSRVADDELRSMAQRLLEASATVGVTKSEADSDRALLVAMETARELLMRSGELIRATFGGNTL